MTTPTDPKEFRDQVLFAFQQACEHPTPEQIIEWTRRFPQLADDIRAHAAIAKDWEAREGFPDVKPDHDMLARGHSRVLNALYNAEVAAKVAEERCRSFQEIMAERGTDVPRLARDLDIARSVLADLVNGGVLAPIGKRLVNALTQALQITLQAFDGAVQRALHAPRIGHAKADGTPTIIPRPFDAVIRSSSMTPERVQYWLTED